MQEVLTILMDEWGFGSRIAGNGVEGAEIADGRRAVLHAINIGADGRTSGELVSLSGALDAGNVAFSVDDAVAGCPWDSSVDAAAARPGGPASSAKAATRASTSPMIEIRR